MIDTKIERYLSSAPSGGRRPEAIDLKTRADVHQMFEARGLAQGRNRQWQCPNSAHPQTGQTPPVSISMKDGYQVWHCHGCDIGGDAITFLEVAYDLTPADAFEKLADLVGLGNGSTKPLPRLPARPAKPKAPPPPLEPDKGRIRGRNGTAHMNAFLALRQWHPDVPELFGLFPSRNHAQGIAITFPYRVDGEVRWWQSRTCSQTCETKWYNPEGHQRIPYALDLATTMQWADETDPKSVIVVEGPADVIALWHAMPGAACIGIPGAAGAEHWAPALAGLDVLILTDPDPKGDKAADKLAAALHPLGGRSARLRPPLDLDDWRRQIGNQQLGEAIVDLAETAEWWTP